MAAALTAARVLVRRGLPPKMQDPDDATRTAAVGMSIRQTCGAGRTIRRRAWIVGMALALGSAGACDDDPVVAGNVQGTWALVDDSTGAVYLNVAADEIEIYVEDTVADCFDRTLYEVVEIQGTSFRLAEGSDTLEVRLRRAGDELILTAFDESAAYAATDADLASLPLCEPSAPVAVCTELPPIVVGDVIERTLSVSDPRNRDGSHYHLYRLTLDATATVVIEMSSSDVDSYLALYDEDGDLVEENDDGSGLSLDARIAPTLGAGCWILMATTAGPDDRGDYELTVSNP